MIKSIRLVISLVVVALVISGFFLWVKSHRTSAAIAPCQHNLGLIELCKFNWANVNRKTSNDVPTMNDLKEEFQSYAIYYKWTNGVPVCPDGGIYKLGRVGERPSCSIGGDGHSLPH